LILTVVFSFIGPIYAVIQPNGAWYALGSIGCKLVLMVLPIMFVMVASALGKLMGRPVSMAYLTYLYSVGTALLCFTSFDSFPVGRGLPGMINDRVRIAPEVLDHIWSTLLVPAVADVEPMFAGNTPVLWGAWFPAMSDYYSISSFYGTYGKDAIIYFLLPFFLAFFLPTFFFLAFSFSSLNLTNLFAATLLTFLSDATTISDNS